MILISKTPCCRRTIKLDVQDVPKEKYERTCPSCMFKWSIERTLYAGSRLGEGVRIDKLVWSMDAYGVISK